MYSSELNMPMMSEIRTLGDGFWNVRGWNSNSDTDNFILRASCVFSQDFDILGVAETHLIQDST